MKRTLVIDGEEQVLNALGFALASEGYRVVKAFNGKEGMKLHREDPVDLIITDLIMPETEGTETIWEFNSRVSKHQNYRYFRGRTYRPGALSAKGQNVRRPVNINQIHRAG